MYEWMPVSNHNSNDDARIIMKGCVQLKPIYGVKLSSASGIQSYAHVFGTAALLRPSSSETDNVNHH